MSTTITISSNRSQMWRRRGPSFAAAFRLANMAASTARVPDTLRRTDQANVAESGSSDKAWQPTRTGAAHVRTQRPDRRAGQRDGGDRRPNRAAVVVDPGTQAAAAVQQHRSV